MWSYYGRKKKIIKYYPEPKHSTIIEPFAGTASYAYEYFDRDVILVDAYDVIIKIWKYLQNASENDILSLPDVENAEFIGDKYSYLCQEERWLIGFCINNGSQRPKHTAGRMNFNSWSRDKIRIANDLYKIKHWNFVLGDYRSIKNIKATWFIDPPYKFQKLYTVNSINYDDLSVWCGDRVGQVIVCEQLGATWMDFSPLVSLSGQRTKTIEVVSLFDNE
jgi:hypothetical protein